MLSEEQKAAAHAEMLDLRNRIAAAFRRASHTAMQEVIQEFQDARTRWLKLDPEGLDLLELLSKETEAEILQARSSKP